MLDTLLDDVAAQPDQDRALAALIEGLAARIKATSNDQNIQCLARELRAIAPAPGAGPDETAGLTGERTMTDPICRCEATIAPSILEGYACGRPDCWRTAVVAASFDAFVTTLVRDRDGEAPAANEPTRDA